MLQHLIVCKNRHNLITPLLMLLTSLIKETESYLTFQELTSIFRLKTTQMSA
jgi:hypothetical protein